MVDEMASEVGKAERPSQLSGLLTRIMPTGLNELAQSGRPSEGGRGDAKSPLGQEDLRNHYCASQRHDSHRVRPFESEPLGGGG